MKTLEEIKNILVKHKPELKQKYKVKKIGIFGSCVRKEKKINDIDILVEFEEPIGFFQFMDLEEYLEKLLSAKVDLVSKKALKPYIGKHILEETVYL